MDTVGLGMAYEQENKNRRTEGESYGKTGGNGSPKLEKSTFILFGCRNPTLAVEKAEDGRLKWECEGRLK